MGRYLKMGNEVTAEASQEVRARVAEILEAVEAHGEEAVRDYSRQLDGWDPKSFRLSEETIEAASATVDEELRRHLELAASQVKGFAEAQLETLLPLEKEIGDGVTLGHRHVPVGSVGAYVPGGQYKLISSALMSVLTAKVAGVGRVVSMSAPSGEWGIHAPTIYAMRLAGARPLSLQVHPETSAVLAYHDVPSAQGTNAFAVQTVQGPWVYD